VSAEEENTNCKLLPGIGRIWYLWHRQDELLTAQFEHRKNSDVIGYSLISQVERHSFVELLILAILSVINQTLFGSVRFTLLYFYGHSLLMDVSKYVLLLVGYGIFKFNFFPSS
jgi:hypothetical protein